jgi:hypothetical protein
MAPLRQIHLTRLTGSRGRLHESLIAEDLLHGKMAMKEAPKGAIDDALGRTGLAGGTHGRAKDLPSRKSR